MDASSITSSKQRFLRTQVRLLSAPLAHSDDWHDHAPVSEQGELSEKVVREVLRKVNTLLRHHNRAVYSSQALRHAAERIDRLYWVAGALSSDTRINEDDGNALRRGTDLRDHDSIVALPPIWPQALSHPRQSDLEIFAESRRYADLRARLLRLSEQKRIQQERLAQHKYLLELMKPFEHPRENVQPNLATKDGELVRELERMRILMERVAEKAEGMEEVRGREDEGDEMMGVEDRLAAMFDAEVMET